MRVCIEWRSNCKRISENIATLQTCLIQEATGRSFPIILLSIFLTPADTPKWLDQSSLSFCHLSRLFPCAASSITLNISYTHFFCCQRVSDYAKSLAQDSVCTRQLWLTSGRPGWLLSPSGSYGWQLFVRSVERRTLFIGCKTSTTHAS